MSGVGAAVGAGVAAAGGGVAASGAGFACPLSVSAACSAQPGEEAATTATKTVTTAMAFRADRLDLPPTMGIGQG
jgi:hypothetical protein